MGFGNTEWVKKSKKKRLLHHFRCDSLSFLVTDELTNAKDVATARWLLRLLLPTYIKRAEQYKPFRSKEDYDFLTLCGSYNSLVSILDKKDAGYVSVPKSGRNPAQRIRPESEKIPAIAQFSPRGGNEAMVGISELE